MTFCIPSAASAVPAASVVLMKLRRDSMCDPPQDDVAAILGKWRRNGGNSAPFAATRQCRLDVSNIDGCVPAKAGTQSLQTARLPGECWVPALASLGRYDRRN